MKPLANCPDESVLADLAERQTAPEEVTSHVRSCASCQQRLASEVARSASGRRAIQDAATESMPGAVAMPFTAAPLERGLNLGRYVLLDKLGEGGMGVVYAAYDSVLDRKVALKFLLGSGDRSRLLREAQVMARLSHPNIVALFDAATFQERVFVSMEYVDGVDLRGWLTVTEGWEQILAVMRMAAQGLVALHGAGFVHRDFKPENVLVGRQGEVKVTDFGLTRPAEAMAGDDPDIEAGADSLVHQRLTRRGRLVGTPGYMAPELVRGEAADALSDQFAFCVALHEALYGVPPFLERAEVRWNTGDWTLRPSPEKSSIPAWIRRVVMRGLSLAREDRFPSMEALLSALDEDPRRRTRRRFAAALGALAIAAAVVGGAVYAVESQSRVCQGAERKLAGIWDGPRRATVIAALNATGVPYAPATAQRVATALDTYAARWVDLRTEACEATRRRGEHSEEILERRMTCLDWRLRELDALADELARPDAPVVERAVQAANELFDLESCLDLDANRFAYDAPKDAATRVRVVQVQQQVDRARALFSLGKPKQALALAEAGRAQAEQLSYPPLRAEALATLGLVQARMMDKSAESTLLDAVRTAEAARHDEVAALAWMYLVRTTWEVSGDRETAHLWADFADAALHRLGSRPALEGKLANHVGTLLLREGKYEEALAQFAHARSLLTREFGAEHEETARVISNMGLVYSSLGEVDKAVETYSLARHIYEQSFGPEHPLVATGYHNTGMGLIEQRHLDEAIVALDHALTLEEKLLGLEHPTVASTLNQLGVAWREKGDFDKALALHRRALSLRQKALGREHADVALTLLFEGETLNRAGRFEEATVSLGEAARTFEKTLGPEHPNLADALTRLGEAALRRAQTGEAVAQLEKALTIRKQRKGDGAYLAANEFLLAQALAESPGQKARAGELARSAAAKFRSLGSYRAAEAAEVERWLLAALGEPSAHTRSP